MLAIRMQRTGRKGYASFRVVVQDSRFAPTSGRVVAKLGHHNPHTKETVIDKEKAEQYMSHGAQPSPRIVRLFESEKIKMPKWVTKPDTSKKRAIKNPDKLRKNQPDEPAEATSEEAPADTDKPVEVVDAATTDAAEKPDESQPTEQPADDDAGQKPDTSDTSDDKADAAEEKPEESSKDEEPAKEEAPASEKAEEEKDESK